MSKIRFACVLRIVAGLTGLTLALGPAGPAVAGESEQAWNPFSASGITTSSTRSVDRSFVKEWEATPPRGFPTLSASNIGPMKAAIQRYTEIEARGGFKAIPDVQMQVGSSGPAVGLLRERLWLSGDLRDQSGAPTYFDYYVEKAVKRFQASNGLTPTGVVDKRTIVALNVPASVRLRQLKVNLTRMQELTRGLPRKFMIVNIPSAQVEAIEGDRVVSRHAGVVGKIDRPTPILRSAVHELNFNPVWTLPPTVIEKDLIPKGQDMQRRNQNVLVKHGIDAYDANGKKLDPFSINWNSPATRNLLFRQQPGKDNPLGFLKINFHNSHAVYMHDTPSETLFGRNFRAASSGCVRVSGIEQLAAWILADNGGWSIERINRMKETGEKLNVAVKRPVPLYFTYITAWATEDGVINFRRDLYNKDGVGAVAGAY